MGYIIPILFFIPLVTDAKNSPFAKFHANQQLNLLIAAVVVNVVGGIIPFIGWFIILPLGSIFLIVVAIMGIINAAKGEMKELPLIGGFKLIKLEVLLRNSISKAGKPFWFVCFLLYNTFMKRTKIVCTIGPASENEKTTVRDDQERA